MCIYDIRKEKDLSFGFDFDRKRLDPCRKMTGKTLTDKRVKEIEARVCQLLKLTPFFDDPYTSLIDAPCKYTITVPHYHLLTNTHSIDLYVRMC